MSSQQCESSFSVCTCKSWKMDGNSHRACKDMPFGPKPWKLLNPTGRCWRIRARCLRKRPESSAGFCMWGPEIRHSPALPAYDLVRSPYTATRSRHDNTLLARESCLTKFGSTPWTHTGMIILWLWSRTHDIVSPRYRTVAEQANRLLTR